MRSVRAQLLAWLLGAVLAVGLAGGYLIYRNALAEANEFFDYHLRETALLLRDQAYGFGFARGLPEEVPQYDFVVQVWTTSGERIYQSNPGVVLPGVVRLGFETADMPGGRWRTFSVIARDLVIQVSQPLAVRESRAARLALRTLAPFGVLIPVLALLIWWIVGRALEPLRTVTGRVASRRPGTFEPLSPTGLPEEIQPLVTALNELLSRLEASLDHERAFIADAAHELRSPLTALDLQLQTFESAADEQERERALAAMRAGVERATRLVAQMLSLAREQQGPPGPAPGPVPLAPLAVGIVEEMLALADRRHIDLGLGAVEPVAVRGDPEALRTLLRNLVDNALRYTPEHGRVDVSVRRDDAQRGRPAVLEVVDNGPGIPEQDRGRVFDRFYRVPGTASTGSGIGLALVRAIAERHQGRVELAAGPGGVGLAVRIVLPAVE
ncbi:MAG TPA: ATP-binding protein [Burkholderiales bacterium]|nr:ATP-binding protein [Burkholderiales bacterium]